MENVSQQTLKYIVKKYFQLFRDKDYIEEKVMIIKTMDPNLAHEAGQAGYTNFIMYKNGEIIKTFAGQNETLSFSESGDTFLDNTIILAIDLKFLVALEGLKIGYSLKLYHDHLLSVYPGDDCPDKKRVISLELLFDVLSIMFKHNTSMDCIGIIKDIIDFKDIITKNLEEIKNLKDSDLPETNALNDSIVQLALRYKDSQIPQDPSMMVRSPGRAGLRKLKKVNYNQFGATDLERLRELYKNNAKEIIGIDSGPFIDILKKRKYLESCGDVSKLIEDLERIKENMQKAFDIAYVLLDQEMYKNYQTEPKNYDDPEEFEKEKKRGTLVLKQYLERNRGEYYNLNVETRSDKIGIKYNRDKKSEELKNITGRVHTTIPFAFGRNKVRLIDLEIKYLKSFT